jgi:hypothetical protein
MGNGRFAWGIGNERWKCGRRVEEGGERSAIARSVFGREDFVHSSAAIPPAAI